MNNEETNSPVPVMFTQSYQWKKSATGCNQSRVYNLPGVPPYPDLLECVSASNLCGGFVSLGTKGYCIDSSTILDSRSTQISDVENITADSKFCIAFQSQYWTTLRSPSCGYTCTTATARWSIGSCIDLTIRPEGFINTSPVATVISPVEVPVNSITNIRIPVIDADNDVLRCRWATTTSKIDECLDVCGVPPGSTLDANTCTLIFNSTGKTVGDYYAIALMVEDFSNASSNTALSSVPIQFLIEIVAPPSCPSKSMINSNISDCTAVHVGDQLNFTVTITQGCSNTTIVDLFTTPPLYMYKSNLTQIGSTDVWTVTETWIPTNEQIGSQIYCAIAIDSGGIQSDQYCLTFTVVPAAEPLLCPGDTTASTTTTTSATVSTSTTSTTTSTTSSSSTTSRTTSTTTSTSSTSTTTQTTTTSSTSTSSSSSTSTSSSSSTSTSMVSQQAITITVPVQSNKDSGISGVELALILGLGLPLALICSGLILCKCCCCQQCRYIGSRLCRQYRSRIETGNNETELNQNFGAKNEENKLPDYREQYVNDSNKSQRLNQRQLSTEKHQLMQESSFTSMPSTELNPLNETITSFYSPSVCSLPNDDVQYMTNNSSNNTNSVNHGSILVHNYAVQENQKMFYTP